MKIAYVAGCTHSGSTLTNRVLGAHPNVVTLGSVKKFDSIMRNREKCCCGAPNLFACEFWGKVNEELKQDNLSLDSLRLQTRRNPYFEQHNLALFSAIGRATGTNVIVDSSRRSSRQQRLAKMSELEVIPIHLYKTPLGQAGSWKKKGRNLRQFVFGYWARNLRILNAFRKDPKTLMFSYEYFCLHPESELRRLFAAFGLEYDPEVLKSWGEKPIHTLGGNHMKHNPSSAIYLDESWRKVLSSHEIRVMNGTCRILWKAMRRRQFGDAPPSESAD